METFNAETTRCAWDNTSFQPDDQGMMCSSSSCHAVMKLESWREYQYCRACQGREAVPAVAVSANGRSPRRIGSMSNNRTIRRTVSERRDPIDRTANYIYTDRDPLPNTTPPIDRLPSWLVSLFKFCVYLFSTLISAIFYPPIFQSITNILSGVFSFVDTLSNKVEWSFTDLLLYLLQFPVAFIWGIFGIAMFIVVCGLVSQSILTFSSWFFNSNTLSSGNRPVQYIGLLAAILAILLGLKWYKSSSKEISPPQETNSTPSSTITVSGSWSFPMPECGSENPPGEQNFYPVFVNQIDDYTLRYIQRKYCNDAFIKYRESVERKSIQVASFRNKSQAQELAQLMLDDRQINSGEVGAPTLR